MSNKQDNNYKALNIRVKKDHINKEHQTQMIGLFKHQAYEQGKTQAEYFAEVINGVYQVHKFIKEWDLDLVNTKTGETSLAFKPFLGMISLKLPRMVEEPVITDHESPNSVPWDDVFGEDLEFKEGE